MIGKNESTTGADPFDLDFDFEVLFGSSKEEEEGDLGSEACCSLSKSETRAEDDGEEEEPKQLKKNEAAIDNYEYTSEFWFFFLISFHTQGFSYCELQAKLMQKIEGTKSETEQVSFFNWLSKVELKNFLCLYNGFVTEWVRILGELGYL